jgi:hypothetical protein
MSTDQPDLSEQPPEWLDDARAMHGLPAAEKPNRPPGPDSSDPAVVKAAQRAARLEARRLGATIGGMMESPDVRAWMYRLLQNCRAFAPSDFPPGARIDGFFLSRNAGQREIAQFITADIMAACPELYFEMLKENAGA